MNRTTIFLMAALATISLPDSLMAQKKLDKKKNPPKKEIKVNREYDEQGNLIRYDSTYVYSWSSDSTIHMGMDSLHFHHPQWEKMQKMMQEHFQNFSANDTTISKFFDQYFFNDRFFGKEFFDMDFFFGSFHSEEFFKQFEQMIEERLNFNKENQENFRQHLDSLHHQFFEQYRKLYPNSIDSLKPQKQKMNNRTSKTVDI